MKYFYFTDVVPMSQLNAAIYYTVRHLPRARILSVHLAAKVINISSPMKFCPLVKADPDRMI